MKTLAVISLLLTIVAAENCMLPKKMKVSFCFILVCNLTCDPGYIADDNCTQCILNDTCTAGNPCQNGGTCTLLSSPDSYTCNCTGTGYTGVNCNSTFNIIVYKLEFSKIT